MKNNSVSIIGMPSYIPSPGDHCESSAMMNALIHQGYAVNESMIAGGGAALGFAFEKSTFPFLNARNFEMREIFFSGAGISWTKRIPGDRDCGWPEIVGQLKKGSPVVLRVDMRYLPYRYNGKYGSAFTSFGWHMITLFAMDEAAKYALVSDTEYTELKRISLKDLHKARTSTTKVWPPRGEYYWIEAKPSDYRLNWDLLTHNSIQNVIQNYERQVAANEERKLTGLSGQKRYGEWLAAIESYVKPGFLIPQVFTFMAANIEEFGTGGAAFRILYRDFLRQAALNSRYRELERLLPLMEDSINTWHLLADEFRGAAKNMKDLSKAEKQTLYRQIQARADGLYRAEEKFYSELKKLYPKW